MRIPNRLLEHRVNITPILPDGSSVGAKYDTERLGIRALIIDKRHRVLDQRAGSETTGTEILSDTHILLHLEDWAPPSSLVTLWPGTPQERTVEVVAAGFYKHSIAPNSAQLWVK